MKHEVIISPRGCPLWNKCEPPESACMMPKLLSNDIFMDQIMNLRISTFTDCAISSSWGFLLVGLPAPMAVRLVVQILPGANITTSSPMLTFNG
jgi:hypothetical protein